MCILFCIVSIRMSQQLEPVLQQSSIDPFTPCGAAHVSVENYLLDPPAGFYNIDSGLRFALVLFLFISTICFRCQNVSAVIDVFLLSTYCVKRSFVGSAASGGQ